MNHHFSQVISTKLKLNPKDVAAVLELIAEGASIPFIARYRKDITGALDEVQIQNIEQEAKFLKEFSDRKAFILKTIEEQGKLSDELRNQIQNTLTMPELEDIYLPYKPKRKTKAQTARENGLEPLAMWLMVQNEGSVQEKAQGFLNEQITDEESALLGARHIISEMINEHAELRSQLRHLFEKNAFISSKVLSDKEQEGIKYKDYFDFSELISKIPSHRLLAILRGFMEGFLKVFIGPEEDVALELIEKTFLKNTTESGMQVKKSIKDAYKKMLQPSLESEFRMALKTKADEEAINVFSENLKQLLLSSPLGSKRIIAIDPGYRTGCKVVVLNENGGLETSDLIYVHETNFRLEAAEKTIRNLVKEFKIEGFAIGDGTAGRETEQFIKGLQLGIPVFLVNEDGASIYSASPIAREEFPDQDITIRGAVSIGRRLLDPLAELVKIDAKSIGVGQYQHDVNQIRLKEKLDLTVESCVNAVGVNLNTSGKHLLQYVSGIGPALAENIIQFRNEHGAFKKRKSLLKVPRLGEKAYEQCAGFLRIPNAEHPLDASGVHPEAYPIVEKMSKDLKVSLDQLIGNTELINQIQIQNYISDAIGKHSIQDILKELKKPGLDPRSEVQSFEFAQIFSIEDVQVGMVVPGIVTNLTRFGAFVDIGVKQDGLVHVSEIANRYISDPAEALKLNQQVMVKVTEVDLPRKRIALSIKQTEENVAKTNERSRKSIPKSKPTASNAELNFKDALASLKGKFS